MSKVAAAASGVDMLTVTGGKAAEAAAAACSSGLILSVSCGASVAAKGADTAADGVADDVAGGDSWGGGIS
jgi:hypothetical protein